MGRNTFGNVVSMAGGVVAASSKSTACKAFKAAVKNWCRDKKKMKGMSKKDAAALRKRKGRFNDYFYRSLARRDKNIARNIRREKGDIFRRVANPSDPKNPFSRHIGSVDAVARGRGPKAVQGAARASRNAFNAARRNGASLDGARFAAASAFRRRCPDTNYYQRFQDGSTPDGKNVEVKGPGDTERKSQYKDGAKAAPKKKLVVVGCKQCGVDCAKGC